MSLGRLEPVRRFLLGLAVLCLPLWVAQAAPTGAYERRVYTAKACTGGPPTVDGRLDDSCWELVDWGTDFVQWEPETGAAPSEQTGFKILYDEEALYLAYRAYDSEPQRIANLLERRDRFPGDWVEVNIDSYHDQRTAFSFTSSVSGTRGDEFISLDGENWDGNWDPVWELATHMDEQGWTAEVRIPFSQLRFSNDSEQVWGLQVQRRLFRKEERSLWQPKAKEDPGWVSRFGELHGIAGVGAGRQIELLPYGLLQGERFAAVPGDPFQDGSVGKIEAGLDGKLGVTNDVTMNFTLNPDFGQVEADPSEINLTAFETFFEEKRPFFIEGRNIFDYQIAPSIAGGSFTSDNLFYSRRVGRQPQGYPSLDSTEVADVPDHTSIIAALKMSGKTSSGVSLGLLESVTAKEKATVDLGGARRTETVEPLSNFLVGRLQKDFDAGSTVVGVMGTAVSRNLDEPQLEFMHRAAYTGGIDLLHRWNNRLWYAALNGAASHVRGPSTSIARTQAASARYYQRPDNDYTTFDPTRTSLTGHAGSLRLGRGSGAGWRFETGGAWRSPGFECNDIGFLRRADEINQFTWVGWASRNPFAIFRRVGINSNQWLNWDFGGHPLSQQVNGNFNMNFKNNWQAGGGVTRQFENVSNTELRGGPSSLWPGRWSRNFWVNGDRRRSWAVDFGGYFEDGDEGFMSYSEWWGGLSLRPTNTLQLSANPSHSTYGRELQYVSTKSFGSEARYLFGNLDQETFGLTLRLDYTLTPNLTLQYYGAPFVSAGTYTAHKRITAPRAEAYRDRFQSFTAEQIHFVEADNRYDVDEDVDGVVDYAFGNPDFNFRDYNSNLVLRWEFQPGSTMFLVWQQSRSDFVSQGTFDLGNDLDSLFDVHPHNVLLLKVNKWFSL